MSQLDINQAELARRAEMDPSEITKLFNGKRGWTLRTMQRIAAALDMPVSDLLASGAAQPPETNVRGRLEAILRQLERLDYAWVERMDARSRVWTPSREAALPDTASGALASLLDVVARVQAVPADTRDAQWREDAEWAATWLERWGSWLERVRRPDQ